MANPFNKDLKAREGTVCGVAILATPVPFGYIRRMLDSERLQDDSDKLLCMADAVGACVRLADGSPIAVDELDTETIGKLFAFAAGTKPGADFTPPASPAGGAQEPS